MLRVLLFLFSETSQFSCFSLGMFHFLFKSAPKCLIKLPNEGLTLISSADFSYMLFAHYSLEIACCFVLIAFIASFGYRGSNFYRAKMKNV